MSAGRILWVGDNHEILPNVMTCMKEAGYEVVTADDELQGIGQLYDRQMDLIIIDGALMDDENSDPYLRLRESSYTPIIILGKHDSQAARMLELGADSFIQAPPDLRELKARIDSMVRRKRRSDPPPRNKGASGDGGSRTTGADPPAKLTPIEHRISSCLELNKGRFMDYPTLIQQVWGGKRVSLDTLHYYVRRVKTKLSYAGIRQLRGIGYLLA